MSLRMQGISMSNESGSGISYHSCALWTGFPAVSDSLCCPVLSLTVAVACFPFPSPPYDSEHYMPYDSEHYVSLLL